MANGLLDISRKIVEDAAGVVRNLQDMKQLSGVNLVLHSNALEAAKNALVEATELRECSELRDAATLADLLQGVNLSGDLSVLEQQVAQELKSVMDSAKSLRVPDINKEKIQTILADLEAELLQMQNAAIKKGIGLLATVARIAIPLL